MIKIWKKNEIKEKMLNKYKELKEEEIEETFREIDKLIEEGKLFKEDDFKGQNLDLKKRDSVIKALCLHVAHTCNLNCEYCFAGQGKYHGEDALMSF